MPDRTRKKRRTSHADKPHGGALVAPQISAQDALVLLGETCNGLVPRFANSEDLFRGMVELNLLPSIGPSENLPPLRELLNRLITRAVSLAASIGLNTADLRKEAETDFRLRLWKRHVEGKEWPPSLRSAAAKIDFLMEKPYPPPVEPGGKQGGRRLTQGAAVTLPPLPDLELAQASLRAFLARETATPLEYALLVTFESGPKLGSDLRRAFEALTRVCPPRGTFNPTLKRLEKNGWVRIQSAVQATNEDRRESLFSLTDQGEAILNLSEQSYLSLPRFRRRTHEPGT